MEGMREKKLYFPVLKSVKLHKAPLERGVSTNFVAYCGFARSSKSDADLTHRLFQVICDVIAGAWGKKF